MHLLGCVFVHSRAGEGARKHNMVILTGIVLFPPEIYQVNLVGLANHVTSCHYFKGAEHVERYACFELSWN